MKQAAYWHVVGSEEPPEYAWTFSSPQGATGIILAYSGVDTGNPVDVTAAQGGAGSTTLPAPSITTTVPHTMLVAFFGVVGRTTIAPPGSMSERAEVTVTTPTPKMTSEGADEKFAAAGATGTRVATASTSGSSGAIRVGRLIALRPAR
jgi:hypothetical protein